MRLILLGMLLAANGASAADRNFSVTSFDRLVVQGPYSVTVARGAPSAHVEGAADAIDALSLDQSGGTLTVRGNSRGDGGQPQGPLTVRLTTPALGDIRIMGAANVSADRLSGDRPAIGLVGDGALTVDGVTAEKLGITLSGAGTIRVAGEAREVGILYQGSGTLDAKALSVPDLSILASGTGRIAAAATHAASIRSQGSATITVAGDIACTVKNAGTGTVRCGHGG